MVSDTLEQRIYELVRSHDGIYLFKKKELTPSTDLDSEIDSRWGLLSALRHYCQG